MGFSRQEYWNGLPFPSSGDLPDPGIEPASPALHADSLLSEPPGKPNISDNEQYLSFFLWLISLSIILFKSIYDVANDKIPFLLWLINIPLCFCVCIYIYTSTYYLIYICIYTHLYPFSNWWKQVASTSWLFHNAGMNTRVHVSFQISIFKFLQIYNQEWNFQTIC